MKEKSKLLKDHRSSEKTTLLSSWYYTEHFHSISAIPLIGEYPQFK